MCCTLGRCISSSSRVHQERTTAHTLDYARQLPWLPPVFHLPPSLASLLPPLLPSLQPPSAASLQPPLASLETLWLPPLQFPSQLALSRSLILTAPRAPRTRPPALSGCPILTPPQSPRTSASLIPILPRAPKTRALALSLLPVVLARGTGSVPAAGICSLPVTRAAGVVGRQRL